METIQQQIGALQVIVAKQQVSVKRQRFAINALAGIILSGVFIAAVRPVGDATFDTITCKGWKVVDKDEKVRIQTSTTADGIAGVTWNDKDEKKRIMAATTADGSASVIWGDKDEKVRIAAATLADGSSNVSCVDKDGKMRIAAGILANGKVFLPISDLNSPKKP